MSRIIQNFSINLLEKKLSNLSLSTILQVRHKKVIINRPRLRNPTWFTKKNRSFQDEMVTRENQSFLTEVARDMLKAEATKIPPTQNAIEWTPDLKRTGVIAKKIGCLPLWLKNGKKIHTTLLQVLDNHVVKYYSPEEFDPPRKRPRPIKKKVACLLVGAETSDPSQFTKEYCGLFKNSGILPKQYLVRFFINPLARLLPGTPLTASHFQVGNHVDVRGKTIDRGFQGVMKRHGFKGMPASHGVTKTHRRPGNIGGGLRARVWPGTKLPGHMGNRWRIAKGLKIWRINTKYNVMWVSGLGIPGETNSIVYIYDTILPLHKPTKPLAFPTYFKKEGDQVPEDIYDESLHQFSEPTILYNESK